LKVGHSVQLQLQSSSAGSLDVNGGSLHELEKAPSRRVNASRSLVSKQARSDRSLICRMPSICIRAIP
jgi:hypothetical protein